MALLDRFFGGGQEYDEEESYLFGDDDEDDDEDDEEEDDENPYGDDDENPDGFGGSPEVNPYALPFDDEEEDDGGDEGEGDGSSGEGKKKKGNKDKKDEKVKVKGKIKKPSSKAELRKNAIAYGCLPNPEGKCLFCRQFSMFKSMRFGDIILVEGPAMLIASSKISTFYCMNKACKHNWKSGWCVRCAGERYIGKKMPMKRVLNKD